MVTLDSWMPESFGADMKELKVGKVYEKNALIKEIGNNARVRVHDPRNHNRVSFFFFKINGFIGSDDRHESMIPESEKARSKDQGGKRVPLRHSFSITPLQKPEPKQDMAKWEKWL